MSEPKWLAAARELVGLKEIVGSKHEPQVVRFFADAGHAWVKDDETAWCAAFANAMLARSGIAGTNSLAARSFLQWGTKLTKPEVGCIVVFKRGSSSWQGHVAFFLREVGNKIEVLGGNQGNAVSIAKYAKSSLLGYRWPDESVRASPVGAPAGYTKAQIKDVQQALLDHGYTQVGGIDGIVGDNTRGAIRDFRANNGLPEGDHIDAALIDALADPAAIGPAIVPERSEATVADIRAKGSTIVNAQDKQVAGAVGAAGVTAAPKVIDLLTSTGEQVAEVQEKLSPFQSALEFAGDWAWVAVVAIVAFLIWQGLRVYRARLRDHQTGNTSVVGLDKAEKIGGG